MPRIRTIKPEFWTSAQVIECSTNARLLFVGLLNFCDDKGRHPASPKQCKAEVFPSDEFTLDDIRRMLDELSTNRLIKFYVVEDTEYFYVTGWHHQRIDRPQEPKYPAPFEEHSTNDPRTLDDHSCRIGREGIVRDSKGKESNRTDKPNESSKTPKRKTQLPKDFELTEERKSKAMDYWASKNREDLNVEDQFDLFLAHHRSNGSTMLDWDAAWQTWYTRAVEYNRKPRNHESAPWEISDSQLMARAQKLGIRTEGKSRQELINKIESKESAQN